MNHNCGFAERRPTKKGRNATGLCVYKPNCGASVPDAGPFKAAFRRNALQFHYSNTLILHHSTALSLLLIAVAVAKSPAARYLGGVVEWLMAPVLKTGRAQALVGSNPTPSAVCGKGLVRSDW